MHSEVTVRSEGEGTAVSAYEVFQVLRRTLPGAKHQEQVAICNRLKRATAACVERLLKVHSCVSHSTDNGTGPWIENAPYGTDTGNNHKTKFPGQYLATLVRIWRGMSVKLHIGNLA